MIPRSPVLRLFEPNSMIGSETVILTVFATRTFPPFMCTFDSKMMSPVKVLSPEMLMSPLSRAVIRDELSLKLLETIEKFVSKVPILVTFDPKSLTFEDWIAEIADPSPMRCVPRTVPLTSNLVPGMVVPMPTFPPT